MSFLWPYLHQHFQFHPASTSSAAAVAAVEAAASVQVAATTEFSGELLMVHEKKGEFPPGSRPLIKQNKSDWRLKFEEEGRKERKNSKLNDDPRSVLLS